MEFHCTYCGRKLTVPDSQAGKKGRCPQCKEALTIPNASAEPQNEPLDRQLLDLPEPTESDQSEIAYADLRSTFGGRILEPEPIPKREYPWIVDIFLYPLNASTLTMLLICVGGPFFLRVLVQFAKVCTIHIPVLLIFWLVSIVAHWIALLLLDMYMVWFVFASMRDSAQGGIRAPNTTAATPGLGELLGAFFTLLVCALFSLAPALAYWIRVGADGLFWPLFAIGGFVFPMALLAVVMHESLRGLNPLLLIRSIGRTFFQYLVLVPFCYVLCLMFPLAYTFILNSALWHWSYVLQAVAFYLLLIMAHLLGRFYFKNDEKLYWDA